MRKFEFGLIEFEVEVEVEFELIELIESIELIEIMRIITTSQLHNQIPQSLNQIPQFLNQSSKIKNFEISIYVCILLNTFTFIFNFYEFYHNIQYHSTIHTIQNNTILRGEILLNKSNS